MNKYLNIQEPSPLAHAFEFKEGDYVKKTGGDYVFYGEVRVELTKKSGAKRYVVENMDGVLMIFNGAVLQHIVDRPFSGDLGSSRSGADDPEEATGGADASVQPAESALNSPGGPNA